MAGINKVILLGNLGKDPETRTLESGVKVVTFSLATTEVYKNKAGEKTSSTEWHNIVLWRRLAEIAETYLKKGTQIYLEGKIRSRSYDDKDGIKRYITEVVGDTFTMLGGRKAEDAAAPAKVAEPVADENFTVNESDDLPF